MKIRRKSPSAEVPGSAMGDIAFNLLIFFVILARAQDDSHVKWVPAETAETEPASNMMISVAIDTEGVMFLNGNEVSESQLAAGLTDMLKGRSSPEDREVLLKIHRDTPAMTFEPVIEAVSEAGGRLVHILQENKDS